MSSRIGQPEKATDDRATAAPTAGATVFVFAILKRVWRSSAKDRAIITANGALPRVGDLPLGEPVAQTGLGLGFLDRGRFGAAASHRIYPLLGPMKPVEVTVQHMVSVRRGAQHLDEPRAGIWVSTDLMIGTPRPCKRRLATSSGPARLTTGSFRTSINPFAH